MSSTCPVQLISIDEDGKCHVQQEAVSVLNQIEGKLAVVGVAGLYRTGKSFLLNRLLGVQAGFDIGPSVNPCTKGIWIWGKPMQLSEGYHCIFVDTEGLGSGERTTSCDMKILSLCLLLSSCFIYNSMGAIDEAAIDDLHLVLNLSKHIHAGAGSVAESHTSLAHYFPSFTWLLRDFHLSLVDSIGEALTPREYLEQALRDAPQQERHNEFRRSIRELFPERDCSTLVRPVSDEGDLQHLERVPYESLRPQFRTQMEEFTKKVLMTVKPKTIDGGIVSGRMFVHLATEYCKAINNKGVPVIKSTWTYLIQSRLRESLKEAVVSYRGAMQERGVRCLPMPEDALRELHKVAKAAALKILLASGLEADPAFQACRDDFKSRSKQVFEQVCGLNAVASQKLCQRCAEDLFATLIEQKMDAGLYKRGVDELMQDWATLQQRFIEKTHGPAQVDVLCNDLFPRLRQCVQRLAPKKPPGRDCTLATIMSMPWKG